MKIRNSSNKPHSSMRLLHFIYFSIIFFSKCDFINDILYKQISFLNLT